MRLSSATASSLPSQRARRVAVAAPLVAPIALIVLACAGPATRPGAGSVAATPASPATSSASLPRRELFLSDWHPAALQICERAARPESLPRVEALVDGDALHAVVDESHALGDAGYVLLSVKFDTSGAPTRARVIESSLAEPASDRLALAVANSLRPQASAAAPWGVRLRLDSGTPTRLRVGYAERCHAAPTRDLAADLGYMPHVQDRRTIEDNTRWEVVVTRDGRVLDATLISATTIPLEVIDMVRQNLHRYHMVPALDDRVPIEGVDTVTIRLVGLRP
jgi:TonB family protein